MSKVKEWIKEVKLVASIIKTLVAVFFCILSFTPIMRTIVRQENATVVKYIEADIERMIIKNADKIQKNPSDVKIEDVEWSLNWWPLLQESDMVNKKTLEQKIKILEAWYRGQKA